jgi:hypothetical protein
MHGDARLYAAQLLAALSLERGACHRLGCMTDAVHDQHWRLAARAIMTAS